METEAELVDVAGAEVGEEGVHRWGKVVTGTINSLSASMKQERRPNQGSVPHPYHWVFQII